MDAKRVPHNLHLFVDTENAPAQAVFKTVNKVCEDVSADVLVMAANHRVRARFATGAAASAPRVFLCAVAGVCAGEADRCATLAPGTARTRRHEQPHQPLEQGAPPS
jgi:hypothetical protein